VYQQWWQQDAVQGWWQDSAREQEGRPYWREAFAMEDKRFETLHSTPNAHGVSVSAEHIEGPTREHGYSGGMRDRIPQSELEPLSALQGAERSDNGTRTRLVLPQNTCVIRSGQNWGACDDAQRAFYLEKVHPVLQEGMRFLRDEGADSGCLLMRFAECCDTDWQPITQSFGLGYARDIAVFENWARSHPTHVAIFDTFMQMVEQFGENLTLQLWHEVTVVGKAGIDCEYINCPDIASALSGSAG
jgi:aldoxime dehydratase